MPKKKTFLWGSIGRELTQKSPGQLVKNLDLTLRKPQFDALVDADIGKRLDVTQIANIRKLALSRGIPESRVAPGFESNLMMFTGSTESRDRYGDRIAVDGWLTNDFKLNPVFLGFHDYEAPAIGQALDVFTDAVDSKTGKSLPNLRGKGNESLIKRLRFLILWATDTNPLAKILHGLYRDKDMRASSVGFIPEEVQVPGDDDERETLGLGPFGVYHKAQTLLELSAVSVPALPGAVADQYLDAYREALPEQEAMGLRKLAEQVRALDAELSKAIRVVLPSASKQFDFVTVAKRSAEAAKAAKAAAAEVPELCSDPPITEEEFQALLAQMQEQGKDAHIPEHLSLAEKAAWVRSILDPEGVLEQTEPSPEATKPGDKLSDMDSVLAALDKQASEKAEETPPEAPPEAQNRGVSPEDVSDVLLEPDAAFNPETLSADSFDFENLSEEQRALVAGFFAWAAEVPPTSFEQLQLGHHDRENGYVNLNGVRAAMEQLLGGETQVPDEDRRLAYDHLANHFEQFGVAAPAFAQEESFAKAAEGSPALSQEEGDGLKAALGSKIDNYKKQLISEVSEQLGIEIAVEEKAGERKWRVVRAHKPKLAGVDDDFNRADFETAVGNNFDLRRECSLIYDAADAKNPRAYIGQHHKGEDGTPVVWKKVRSTMRLLLSKAFDGTIDDSVRRRAFFHLRTHYDQFEQEAPSFRSVENLVALGSFLKEMARDLTDEEASVREAAEITLDMVFMGYQSASDTAFAVQALKFPKKNWEREGAKEYARERGYSVDHAVETESAFVFEQRGKDEFLSTKERLHESDSDVVVFAIAGKLRSGVGLLAEKVENMKREFSSEIRKLREQLGGDSRRRVEDLLPSIKNSGRDTYTKIYEQSASIAKTLKDAVAAVAVKE